MRDVYAKGAKIGEERVPSDRLLMFLLKHLDSIRYGKLSGLQPAAIPDPVPAAQARLPGAVGKLVDQPIEADRDWFEQFDRFQRLPEYDRAPARRPRKGVLGATRL